MLNPMQVPNQSRKGGGTLIHALSLFAILAASLEQQANAFDQTPGETFQVGLASVDITPDYPVLLNGFLSRQNEVLGARQRIWAKAISIRSQDHPPLVLIAADTLGIPAEIRAKVLKAIEPMGVDNSSLAITASHTHSAPIIRGCAPNIMGRDFTAEEQQHIDRYTQEFTAKLIEVAKESLKAPVPATLSWSVGKVQFAKNRRSTAGPIDHDLPLLAAHDLNGKLLAVSVSYACHCVTLSESQISGDWAGYTQTQIQAKYPDCLALVSIGCAGDQNPTSNVTVDRIDVADTQGKEIADEVSRLLSTSMTKLEAKMQARWKEIELPLEQLPTREEFAKLAEQNTPIGYHARKQLAKLDRGEALPQSITYPVQAWTLGKDLSIAFLAGEVTVEYGLRLKSSGCRWVNAYANACPCYIPSESVLKQGGYEGRGAMIYYDWPTAFRAGLENSIIQATSELLR